MKRRRVVLGLAFRQDGQGLPHDGYAPSVVGATLNSTVQQIGRPTVKKTVVELDLINYSERARRIQNDLGLGAEGVGIFNKKVQEIAEYALQRFKLDADKHIRAKQGDGFILLFDTAVQAHDFCVLVHERCNELNRGLIDSCATNATYLTGVKASSIFR